MSDIGKVLGVQTDAMNAAYQRAEKLLESLQLGVSGAVALPDQNGLKRIFTFRKEGGAWMLCTGVSVDGKEWTYSSICSVSREVRVECSRYLEQLVYELRRVGSEVTEVVQTATKTIEDVCDWIASDGEEGS